MRVHHLIEQAAYDCDEELEYLARHLAKQCGEFFAEANRFLYRGGRGDQKPVWVNHARTDRRPLSSSLLQTNIINYFIHELLDVPNIRQRCIFTSTGEGDASFYGYLHYAIPINGSEAVYDEQIADSYLVVSDADKLLTETMLLGLSEQDRDAFKTNLIRPRFELIADTTQMLTDLVADMSPEGAQHVRHGFESLRNMFFINYNLSSPGEATVKIGERNAEVMIIDSPGVVMINPSWLGDLLGECGRLKATHRSDAGAIFDALKQEVMKYA